MDDRIKLTEAMGWSDCSDDMGKPPNCFGFDYLPDPFTDANDDYAVLEWVLKTWSDEDQLKFEYAADCHVLERKIGDYARATLKIINQPTT